MKTLSQNGNGNYYIDSKLEAKKVLVEEMGGTLYTIDAGEIGAGHKGTALYEIVAVDLKYQEKSTVISGEWLTVSLRYKEPQGVIKGVLLITTTHSILYQTNLSRL